MSSIIDAPRWMSRPGAVGGILLAASPPRKYLANRTQCHRRPRQISLRRPEDALPYERMLCPMRWYATSSATSGCPSSGTERMALYVIEHMHKIDSWPTRSLSERPRTSRLSAVGDGPVNVRAFSRHASADFASWQHGRAGRLRTGGDVRHQSHARHRLRSFSQRDDHDGAPAPRS